MAVDSQLTTEMLRTSKSISITANMIPFLQPSVHSAGIDVVNTASLHNPHVQTTKNNMSAANQPTASNVFMPQGNSPNSSTRPILDASTLSYSNDQLAD